MNTSKLIATMTLSGICLLSFSSHAWQNTNNVPVDYSGNGHYDSAANGGFNFNMGFNGRTNTQQQPDQRPLVLRGVNFEFDSARLTSASTVILDVVADTLKKYPGTTFEVSGHASAEGHELYNLDLSARRAGSVRDYLVKQGVAVASLSAYGHGEYRPRVSNATREGREENRRVELTPTYRIAMK